jgi:N-acylneuraminate cytidylyltransferase
MNQTVEIMINQLPCLILARGGSKGIKNKNIKLLLDKPLIGWVIESAQSSNLIGDIWVSTDCQKIAEVSKKYGAKIIDRPKDLAGDDSLDVDAFRHALNFITDSEQIVHLRATTPIINPERLDQAIKYFLYNKDNCDSLRSGHKMSESIFKFFTLEDNFFTPISNSHFLGRQNVEKTYIPNGYIDIIKIETIKKTDTLHGDKILAFETEVVIEIDTIEEFEYLEYKLIKNNEKTY